MQWVTQRSPAQQTSTACDSASSPVSCGPPTNLGFSSSAMRGMTARQDGVSIVQRNVGEAPPPPLPVQPRQRRSIPRAFWAAVLPALASRGAEPFFDAPKAAVIAALFPAKLPNPAWKPEVESVVREVRTWAEQCKGKSKPEAFWPKPDAALVSLAVWGFFPNPPPMPLAKPEEDPEEPKPGSLPAVVAAAVAADDSPPEAVTGDVALLPNPGKSDGLPVVVAGLLPPKPAPALALVGEAGEGKKKCEQDSLLIPSILRRLSPPPATTNKAE